MTSITSGKQTCATVMQERVRTARPAKLRPGLKTDTDDSASKTAPASTETMVANVVPDKSAADVRQQRTERLLVELNQLWSDIDAPVDAYMPTTIEFDKEVKNDTLTEITNEEALMNRLNEISQFYSGTGCEIAEQIESEHNQSSDNRLGTLLVDLGLITEELLEHTVKLAMDFSISLGRVLIMSGWVTGKQLQWAIQLQALLKDGLITKAGAVQVADLMSCAGMTMQRALNCAGFPDALTSSENRATRIGDLLVEAGVVTAEEFNCALQKSQFLGMQVGRYLMIAGLVAEPLLETIVNAQRFVRENKITRDDAIVAIKCASQRHADMRKSLAPPIYSGVPLKSVRLGELLSLAGIVSDVHIEHAVEFGLRCNLAVGQVLIDLEIITKPTLDTALTLQDLVSQGSIETIDAVYALIDVHHHGYTLEQSLKRNRGMVGSRKSLSFEQFLASVEVISTEQIEESIETARRSPLFVSKALVLSGALSDETVQVALVCHFYVRENMLNADQALLLFNLCHRTGISVDDGLKELGMTVRPQVTV